MNQLKDFLKYVDASELHDKICDFRDLDFKHMSYQDVQNAISKVITFTTPTGNIGVLTSMNSSYPAGTRFYRVRTIPSNDRNIPLDSMSTVADCWESPESIVHSGRLNRDNESLLYTAPQTPVVAVEELRVSDKELFSLIVYEATEQINVTMIGAIPNLEGLDKGEALKARMIQDFLKHEFVRDVGAGTEYLYRISESITKDYFDLPPEFQDAWCYPSVAKKGGFNVCFRKEKRAKLKLIGVQIASVQREDTDYLFNAKLIAIDCGDGINLSYHKIGSEVQEKLFPEMMATET